MQRPSSIQYQGTQPRTGLELTGKISISAIVIFDMELADKMEKILDYLNKHGECLDTEISVATRIPLNNVHLHLNELMAAKQVMTFHATRYVDCTKSEVTICRLVRKGPALKPQRKSKRHTLN